MRVAETSLIESSTDETGSSEDSGPSLTERLLAAGIAPVSPSDLFDDSFVDAQAVTPLLVAYFPVGCMLALFRMALWIGGIALDLPAWRRPGVIAGFLSLLGVRVIWRGDAAVPPGRHVLVSNHVSNGDLLMLFPRPNRYLHLITPLLPAPVFKTKNLPAILAPASKDTYESLAELAAREGTVGGNGSGDSGSSSNGNGHAAGASVSNGNGHGAAAVFGGSGGAHIGVPAAGNGHAPAAAFAPSGGSGAARSKPLPPEWAAAPVHLFPEGGMTNGKGMMAFSRGFTKFAADGASVVPVALRLKAPFPQVRNHTMTSSFLANLFFFSWQPWAELEATALPPMATRPGEGRGAFAQRVQETIALELRVPVAAGFTVQHKRALVAKAGAGGSKAAAAGGARRRRG